VNGRPVFRDLRWGVYVVLKAPNEYARTCTYERADHLATAQHMRQVVDAAGRKSAYEMLDGEGGYTVWGKLVPAERNLAESAIPIGLAQAAV